MMSFVLDMLSLRYPAGYPGAKGLEGSRECEPGAQEKKIRMRGMYLGVISKEMDKGIIEGENGLRTES